MSEQQQQQERLSGAAFRYFVQEVRQALIKQRRSDYDIGKHLTKIRDKDQKLWNKWPRGDRPTAGYRSWTEFCEKELGHSKRKADTLINNYKELSEYGLDEDGDVFARCMRIGYSKLAWLLRVCARDANALGSWLDAAEGRSERELRDIITEQRRQQARDRQIAAGGTGEDGDEDEPLSQDNPVGFVQHTIRFPDQSSLETFTMAVELIRSRYDDDIGAGRAVAMMATQYVATVPRDDQGGAPVELENLIRIVEASYGVRLQVVPQRSRPRRRRSRS